MNECKIMISENFKNKKIKKKIRFENNTNILYDNIYTKIITINLEENVINKINEYFNLLPKGKKSIYDFFPWYTPKKSAKEIMDNSFVKIFNFDELTVKYNYDEYFIDTAMSYLINNGFNVKKEGQIEYKSINLSNNENNAIFSDVYKDNEILGYNAATCIFIIQENKKIFGNIDAYIIQPGLPKTPNKYANVSEYTNNIIKKEIIITGEQVILMSGNIIYCPQPLYGYGVRSFIIVRLRN
jgi:hypothetical protein